MDLDAILTAARPALERATGRFADLVRSAPDLHQSISRSAWTIQQAAAHVVVGLGLYEEIAAGAPSPFHTLEREWCAAESARRLADVPEDHPGKLADLVTDAAGRYLEATAGRPGDHTVSYHCGERFHVAGLTCVLIGEAVLHGYDVAVALRRPWPIDPGDALLALAGYAPIYHLIVHPERTRGLNLAVSIDLRDGGPGLVARFREGSFAFEAPGAGPVDAAISADPVAYLMVGAGRLDRWAAMALGQLSVGGEQPDLALAFPDFFVYP